MPGATEPHWRSFLKNVLPHVTKLSGTDLTKLYFDSLERYDELDYYRYQSLPFANCVWGLGEVFSRAGMAEREVVSITHTLLEEGYGVMSFHKHGCRIIRPTEAAVRAFRNTDVNVPIVDIAPPYPIVWIQLPPNQGLQVKVHEKSDRMVDLEGMYVTWSRTGAETARAFESSKACGLARNKWGMLVPTSAAGEGAQPVEVTQEFFGDWAFRVQALARCSESHDYTIIFFNMRWMNSNTEEAEGAYHRFSERWIESYEKCAGGKLASMELNEQLFHLVANLYLYMSQKGEDEDTIWVPNPERERLRIRKHQLSSKQRRNLRRRLLEEMPTEEWIVGQKLSIDKSIERVDNSEQPGLGGAHVSPKTHWRRGHWHRYWTGPQDGERKLVYRMLKPMLIVGSGGKPDYTLIDVDRKEKA